MSGELEFLKGAVTAAPYVVPAGWAGRKLVGPLLDAIGNDIAARYTNLRIDRASVIVGKAERKLGDRINEPGQVPPRVALHVLDEGSMCEGELMSEYWGGILAASRSDDPADDRGVTMAAIVSRLSTYDVLVHYLLYDALRRAFAPSDATIGSTEDRSARQLFVPGKGLLAAMGLPAATAEWERHAVPAISALSREGLVFDLSFGAPEKLSSLLGIDTTWDGLKFEASLAGLELFLWAHGYTMVDHEKFLSEVDAFTMDSDVGHLEGARPLREMQDQKQDA